LARGSLRFAGPADCDWIGPRLRPNDLAEMEAFYGPHFDPAEVLKEYLEPRTMVVDFDGRPTAIFGCPEIELAVGSPWMLATRELSRYPLTVHANALDMVNTFRERFNHLTNIVWAGSSSIPWLRRLGFQITQDSVYQGPTGEAFLRFSMNCLHPLPEYTFAAKHG
jgi:hypothetical protein